MGWFEPVKTGIQKVNRFIAGVGAWFLIPLMIITAFDVVSRDIFNRSIPGTVELSQYMLAVFILLGLAYTHQVKAHVAVSFFTTRLPLPIQTIFHILSGILCLFISCVIAWQGWVIGIEEKSVSDLLRIQQYPFRLLVAFAALLLCLELLIDLGDSLKKFFGGPS
jgi:TRAP-type C4-dicarboxylate transport system permease small subunit